MALLVDGEILIANVGNSKALFFAQRKFSLAKGTGSLISAFFSVK